MITRLYWRWQKKRHLKRKIKISYMKIWDLEFLLDKFKAMREGFRMEYDRLMENFDAAKRRIYEEKYTFFYSSSGEKVSVRDLPLPYSEIDKLPNKPTDPFRFHKIENPNPDMKICDNLENLIKKLEPDINHLKLQMDAVNKQIEGVQNPETGQIDGIKPGIEGFRTVIELLRESLKKL